MAVITSGKTFANGEQLSADKLNQVITAATFNASDAVDGSTMTLIGGAMAVRDSGITKSKIENVANMKVLGNTSGSATSPQEVAILDEDNMSTDSDTSLATQQSIKAFVTAMRPKFVSLTGGTTDLTKTTSSVSTVEYTYNIADFTSSDSDFGTSKIVALIVQGFTSSGAGQNNVRVRLPNDDFTVISSTSADSTADFTQDHGSTNIPINPGQSSVVIKHAVSDAQTTAATSIIKGAIIQPGL
jgi:hypothetical protein